MIATYSGFYYNLLIDDNNRGLDYSDDSGDHAIQLTKGSYTHTSLAIEIARQMTKNSSTNNYLVSVDRKTRLYTIESDLAFNLKFASGYYASVSICSLIGFEQVDLLTNSLSYSGTLVSGSAYYPQFFLKNYIDAEDSQNPLSAVVNKSSNGENYEIVKFGSQNFYRFEIIFTTDLQVGQNSLIKENLNGISDLREFMKYITKKYPVEFIKDISDPETFDKVILESTPQSQDGVGFEISPDYGNDLPDYVVLGGALTFKRLS